MKRLPLVGSASFALAMFVSVEGSSGAWAAIITSFSPPLPMTFGLTVSPPGTYPGYTAYRFSLSDYFPGSPNPLPEGVFTENELSTNLVLIGGFGPSGMVDPINTDQTVEFSVGGDYWRHHLSLTLHAKSFPIFSADTVSLNGFVQHLVAPHEGEVAPGPEVKLMGSVAGNAAVTLPPDSFITADQFRRELQRHNITLPAQGRFGFDAKSEIHSNGPHEDTALALLVAQAPGSNAETFDWYEVGTAASHPVPEPPGYMLLGTIVVNALIVRRKRLGQGTHA
jgi:hypothetical protein